MEKLKPCPFCGSEAKLERTTSGYRTGAATTIIDAWKVSCQNCRCERGPYQSKIFQNDDGEIVVEHNGAEEAINAWNTRAE